MLVRQMLALQEKKVLDRSRPISRLQKSVRDLFKTNGFLRILMDLLSETNKFLPKVYEVFWSEMPLGQITCPDSWPIVCFKNSESMKSQYLIDYLL